MNRPVTFAFATLLLAGPATPAGAQEPWRTLLDDDASQADSTQGQFASGSSMDLEGSYDRFRLFTGCQPVHLVVDFQADDDNAPDLDLAEDDIGRAVRSRLRSARIYNPDSNTPVPQLRVWAGVFRNAFSIGLSLEVYVRRDGLGAWAVPTWRTTGFGTHGGDGSYVLSRISRYTDEFINEYLRVNGEACDRRDALHAKYGSPSSGQERR